MHGRAAKLLGCDALKPPKWPAEIVGIWDSHEAGDFLNRTSWIHQDRLGFQDPNFREVAPWGGPKGLFEKPFEANLVQPRQLGQIAQFHLLGKVLFDMMQDDFQVRGEFRHPLVLEPSQEKGGEFEQARLGRQFCIREP